MCMCCRLLFYFSFSGNLALCDAFNNLRIDEWRKFKSKRLIIGLLMYRYLVFTKRLAY
jgi:hypothetical protein